MEAKKQYQEPELKVYGELRQLTLGNNGSLPDANCTRNDQVGGGSGQCENP